MGTARSYIFVSAITLVVMVVRLGCTDRPGILHIMTFTIAALGVLVGILVALAILVGLPMALLFAVAALVSKLFSHPSPGGKRP